MYLVSIYITNQQEYYIVEIHFIANTIFSVLSSCVFTEK